MRLALFPAPRCSSRPPSGRGITCISIRTTCSARSYSNLTDSLKRTDRLGVAKGRRAISPPLFSFADQGWNRQTATVNAELKPGAASELIEVTGEAPVLDLAKTDVSQNIRPRKSKSCRWSDVMLRTSLTWLPR